MAGDRNKSQDMTFVHGQGSSDKPRLAIQVANKMVYRPGGDFLVICSHSQPMPKETATNGQQPQVQLFNFGTSVPHQRKYFSSK